MLNYIMYRRGTIKTNIGSSVKASKEKMATTNK